MKKEQTSGNNLNNPSVSQDLFTVDMLVDEFRKMAPELCRNLNYRLRRTQASGLCTKKSVPFVDLTRSVRDLSFEERIVLQCIDHIRIEYSITGRKWLSVMLVIRRRCPLMSLNDAYAYIMRLYGENWHVIQFDFYNAIRNYAGKPSSHDDSLNLTKMPIQYAGVERKYSEIIEKLDAELDEFLKE